jgi:beta-galactosidase
MKSTIYSILILCFFIFSNKVQAQNHDYLGEKISIDRNWRFQLGDASSDENEYFQYNNNNFILFAKSGRMIGVNSLDFPDNTWQQVNLPHDWAIELDFINDKSLVDHGFKPVGYKFPKTSVGWYRKRFDVSETDRDKRLTIKFDGVYRDCQVWLNGFYLGNNLGGYMEFMYDVTDFVEYGKPNLLTVRVDATQNEGWWYEGAGIYRHAWLIKKSTNYIPEHGTYITTDIKNNETWVNIQTSIENKDKSAIKSSLEIQIIDAHGKIIGKSNDQQLVEGNSQKTIASRIKILNPTLWSIENPYLYKVVSSQKQTTPLKTKRKQHLE